MSTINDLPVVATLLRKYSGYKDIPATELEANGLKLVHDKARNTYGLITEEEYKQKCVSCFALLSSYDGYIFSDHLDLMWRHFALERIITDDKLSAISARGKRFVEAGIPPIFPKELCSSSALHTVELVGSERIPMPKDSRLFPTVDLLIQLPTGAYDRKRAAIAIERRKVLGDRRDPLAIQPSTVQDVLDFCRVAFTPEKRISEFLIREMEEYTRVHFNISEERLEWILEHQRIAFMFLQDALQPLLTQQPQYNQWDGNIGVVDTWWWHLRFAPSDRMRIAKTYFDSLEKKPTKSQKERKIFLRMKAVFPELAGFWAETHDPADHVFIGNMVRKALAAGDLRGLPTKAFVDLLWRDSLLVKFQEMCEKLDTEKLFDNIKQLHEHLSIPQFLVLLPHYRDVIYTARTNVVRACTDEDFRKLVASFGRGYGGLCTGNTELIESQARKEFLELLRQRRVALKCE